MLQPLFFSLRPKQWIKNLFVLIPVVFGNKLLSYPENLKGFLGVGIFCMISSAVYLVNDLVDYEGDKRHPFKKMRPLAAGKISRGPILVAAVFLTAISLALGFMLGPEFDAIVLLYLAGNLIYSKFLKHIVIIDVLSLGFFFLLRVLAGCFLAGVEMSHWLLFMTVLLALFLGFNKRRQELKMLGGKAESHRKVLLKYDLYFIDQVIGIVTASIVVVYMLYTVDAQTVRGIGSNHLMFTIPFVYYGLFRYLYLLHKLHKDGDPTRILLMDRVSQVNIAAWGATAVAVIYFKL